jgi:hypothetical protein
MITEVSDTKNGMVSHGLGQTLIERLQGDAEHLGRTTLADHPFS